MEFGIGERWTIRLPPDTRSGIEARISCRITSSRIASRILIDWHVAVSIAAATRGLLQRHENATSKKVRPPLGGRGGRARTRSGDGEGWGRDRGRVAPCLLFSAPPQW